ncbi:mechanosensitive ion channel family protein [Streptomyces sp. KLOTTS4A1]|uniref:mechanosensitive ion channel family protein n=1 Tax=Streptomyces sp. KLOTTS4A1 TaxID=3390996 RepID=UPI0039F50B98
MLLSALTAADPSVPPTLEDAQEKAGKAAGWVEENWSTWLAVGLRILLIVVIAVVLRHLVRKAITKFIERMNRTAPTVDGTPLGGMIANAERRRQRSEAIGSVLRSTASLLIMGTAALMVLGAFSIDLAPLLASAGVAGVALGFGARNLVMDFLTGVFMIIEDQYGVGDTIDADVASGEVVEVGLRVTKLRGENGAIWYLRNGEVKRIGNLSQGWATAHIDVTVRPDEDLDKVQATILDIGEQLAAEEPWNERLWGPVEVLGLDAVYLDSMVIRVSAKTMPGKAVGVERELRWRIKRTFDAAGIRIVGGLPQVVEAAGAEPVTGVAAPSAHTAPAAHTAPSAHTAPIPAQATEAPANPPRTTAAPGSPSRTTANPLHSGATPPPVPPPGLSK